MWCVEGVSSSCFSSSSSIGLNFRDVFPVVFFCAFLKADKCRSR